MLDGRLQKVEPGPGRRRNPQLVVASVFDQVALGPDDDQLGVLVVVGQERLVVGVGPRGSVDQVQQDIAAFDELPAPANSFLFHLVGRRPKARGVNQAQGDSVEADPGFEPVAGGPVLVAHNGAVFLQKQVEQRRLAGVGPARQSHGNSFLKDLPGPVGGRQGPQFFPEGVELFEGNRRRGHVVFGVVELDVQQGHQVEDTGLDGRDAPRDRTRQAVEGQRLSLPRAGGDHFLHRLGPGQIELSVQKSPQRELAGVGRPKPSPKQSVEDAP